VLSISILYHPADARAAHRLTKALAAVHIGKPLRQRYSITEARPLRAAARLRSDAAVPLQPCVIALLSSSAVAQPEFNRRLAEAKDAGAILVPAYFEARQGRSTRPFESFFGDTLAIDLTRDADGWRDGPLKIAARLLRIPFAALRDRQVEKDKARFRYNLFATAGLVAISLVFLLLWRQAGIANQASLDIIAAATYVADNNGRLLWDYAKVPNATATGAIESMKNNLARVEAGARILAFHFGSASIAPAMPAMQHLRIGDALRFRGQYDEAVAFIERGRALVTAQDFKPQDYLDADAVVFEFGSALGVTYALAGEHERAVAVLRALAQAQRDASQVSAATRCARLASAHAYLILSIVQLQPAGQRRNWPSAEIEEARACTAAIVDGPLDTAQLPSTLVAKPRDGAELRATVRATTELFALWAATLREDAGITAQQRIATEEAVAALEVLLGEGAQAARQNLLSYQPTTELSLRANIENARNLAAAAPYSGIHMTSLVAQLEKLAKLRSAQGGADFIAASQHAEALQRNLLQADPTNLRFRAGMAEILDLRARVLNRQQECRQAGEAAGEALSHYDAVVTAQKLSAGAKQARTALATENICEEKA
jgi:hypothetical protein